MFERLMKASTMLEQTRTERSAQTAVIHETYPALLMADLIGGALAGVTFNARVTLRGDAYCPEITTDWFGRLPERYSDPVMTALDGVEVRYYSSGAVHVRPIIGSSAHSWTRTMTAFVEAHKIVIAADNEMDDIQRRLKGAKAQRDALAAFLMATATRAGHETASTLVAAVEVPLVAVPEIDSQCVVLAMQWAAKRDLPAADPLVGLAAALVNDFTPRDRASAGYDMLGTVWDEPTAYANERFCPTARTFAEAVLKRRTQNESLGEYRHFKGDLYTLDAYATHSETGEAMVVYTNVGSGQTYVRPEGMFFEMVSVDLDIDYVPRFERVRA